MLMHPGMPVMSGEVTRRAALRGDGLLRMSIGMTENRRVTRTGVKKHLLLQPIWGIARLEYRRRS